MKLKRKEPKFNDSGWAFATINNRLAEIFFNKKVGIWGYCYIQKSEYSKKEQETINMDIKNNQFTFRRGIFRDKLKNIVFPLRKFKKSRS